MSDLFIRLYLDEDVSALIATLLRSRGFVATTTLNAGRLGATDDQQLAYVAENQMAILTHNRVHFDRLASQYIATGRTHHGIIIAVRRRPHEIARRLLLLLNQVTANEMYNQVRYI